MHLTVPVTQPFYSTLKFRAAGFEPAWLSDIKCRDGATALTNLVRGYAVFPIKLRPVSRTAVVTQHCRVLLRFFYIDTIESDICFPRRRGELPQQNPIPFTASINQNASYAGSRLNEWAYYLGKNNNQYNYNSFCKQLYYEYDKCSFILGLKIHSLSYRISRKQYHSKFLLVAYLLIHVFALLIAISITLILFTTVLVITQRLLGL